MRGDLSRFEAFAAAKPYTIVHEFCINQPDICTAKLSFDGDEPWLDTQDLQAYDDGRDVAMTPVEIAAMFDGLRGSGCPTMMVCWLPMSCAGQVR